MNKTLILGPPGTGKTTTLLNKVEQLLAEGVEPEEIAYVSFTRKAANEARDRACERFDLDPDRFENFRTLHSLAFKELGLQRHDVMGSRSWKEFGKASGYDFRNVSVHDGAMTAAGTHGPFLFHLALARLKCVPLEQWWDVFTNPKYRSYYLHRAEPMSRRNFFRMRDRLEQYKTMHNVLDFTDMLEHGLHLPALPIRYAIIDEAQDLSVLQWRFCKQVFGNVEQCWIAGDDDQAIYQWAGADLYTFRHMEAQREVLSHSWRLPGPIHAFAQRLVNYISDRYAKDFSPREGEGEFRTIEGGDLSLLPLQEEEWMLLTRTKTQQNDITEYLRSKGYIYEQQGKSSIVGQHERAIRAWTRLVKGGRINALLLRDMFAVIKSGDDLDRGAKTRASEVNDESTYDMQQLRDEFGLRAQGEWFDALKLIPQGDINYYRSVFRKGQKLTDSRRIRVNTIHSVKGGECDNVYMSTNLGAKAYRVATGYPRLGRDPELRVQYVAATRAKKRLFLNQDAHYGLPEVALAAHK